MLKIKICLLHLPYLILYFTKHIMYSILVMIEGTVLLVLAYVKMMWKKFLE